MSANELDITGKPKRGRWFGRILAMLLALIVVLGALAFILFPDALNVDAIRRWVKYLNVRTDENGGTYSFDFHNSNRYASFDGGLAIASVGGLSVYTSDGREAIVSQGQLSLPVLQTGKDLAMTYDVGGPTLLAVHRRNGEVLRITSEKAILDADLSAGDDICYASSASGYKSVLTVYNDKQERVYRWLSSSTYMPLCAIADSGTQLAAIGLDQKNGVFESTLNLFRTHFDQIERTVSLGNELIYDVDFTAEDEIVVIGETSVKVFDASGEILGNYPYGDSFLKDFELGGNGFLTLSMNMYRAGNRYSLVTLDQSGRELASLYIGQEILDFSACGKYLAVLTSDGLTIYTRLLEEYDHTEEVGAATSVVMCEDGTVLLLGGGTGKIYIP